MKLKIQFLNAELDSQEFISQSLLRLGKYGICHLGRNLHKKFPEVERKAHTSSELFRGVSYANNFISYQTVLDN